MNNKFLAFAFVIFLSILSSQSAWSAGDEDIPIERSSRFKDFVLIFEIKKNIPLTNNETPRRDYYINAGSEKGMQNGATYKVYRRQAAYDPYLWRFAGELKVEVGELKIIYVDRDLSIGRLIETPNQESLPITDYPSPMKGDIVDVKNPQREVASIAPGTGLHAAAAVTSEFDVVVLKAGTNLPKKKSHTRTKKKK